MFIWAQVTIFIIQCALAMLVGYLLLLTSAAFMRRKQTNLPTGGPNNRFLILVPAHNEERLLPNLLENLAQLDYPASLFAVHVVADNCMDQTVAVAQAHHAVVHERINNKELGKGYALQWLLDELWQCQTPHDAVVILDADSLVSRNFLGVMNARLTHGERAIQAYYAVRDPGRSWNGSLRYAALAVLHYLRPQGRMVLGGSAGLKGNGMAFSADLIRRHRWSGSITEDIDLHMSLILDGERVMFAPDAVVVGEMPDSLASSESQTARWERGRLQMRRRYLMPLMRAAWVELNKGNVQRAFLFLDAAMEHIIPPFSLLMGINLFCLSASLILLLAGQIIGLYSSRSFPLPVEQTRLVSINLFLGVGLLLGQFIYLLAGLRLVSAPRFVYQRLLYVPAFLIWKIWQYFRILLGRGQQGWVRTTRNGG